MAYLSGIFSRKRKINTEWVESHEGSFCFLPKPDYKSVCQALKRLTGRSIHFKPKTEKRGLFSVRYIDKKEKCYHGRLVEDPDGFTIERPFPQGNQRYIELGICYPGISDSIDSPTHHIEILVDNRK